MFVPMYSCQNSVCDENVALIEIVDIWPKLAKIADYLEIP